MVYHLTATGCRLPYVIVGDRHELLCRRRLHSNRLTINSSIIQGPGLGPVLFVINAHDLHPIYPTNLMFKYADDT